jgi:hypothetical protein
MAINFTTIKNTNQEIVIHFESPATIQNGTITIADLAAASQARNSDTPKVNIVRFVATGEVGSAVIVQRDGKTVIVCAPENAPFLDLPSMGISENQKNGDDIVIQNQVAKQVTGYITLRKIQGWSTKVETATYGAYDDTSRVGASTSLDGSPEEA